MMTTSDAVKAPGAARPEDRSPGGSSSVPNGEHAPNGETAAMINAEVNEGGPPSPIPCDTPAEVAATVADAGRPPTDPARDSEKP
jgi:hypothetical protein